MSEVIELAEKIEEILAMPVAQHDMAMKGYKILVNEIIPRAKKCKLSIGEFIPSEIAHFIVRLETLGLTTRRDTRRFLDLRMKDL
jgi:hypothetical protein